MKKVLVTSANKAIVVSGLALCIEDGTLPSAYRKLTGIAYDGDTWYETGLHLRGSDTLRFSFLATAASNVIGCYTGSSADDNYTLYASSSSSGAYMRYDGGLYRPRMSLNTRYDVVITPTGCDSLTTAKTWTEASFTASAPMFIGWLDNASSAPLSGEMYGNIVVDGRAIYVPAERVSDGEIGYYELVSETFDTNQGTGTPVSLGYES